MNSGLQRIIALLIASVLLTNCVSTEKYNAKLEKPISVKNIKKDIEFTQHKLEKYYPSLYGYISKEQLNSKFDSIRNVVNKPITSKEFYFLIAPVIASVRQGHMTMSPATKKVPKKDAKRYKKMGDGPLSQFTYEWQNNKLYILKNKSKKKYISVGTEVLSVNQITPQELHEKYRKSFTSDGFNQTFLRKFFSKRYITYMTNEIGINDSLTFVFKKKDSVFTAIIARLSKDKKAIAKPIKSSDSISKITETPKIVKADKNKIKAERKSKKIYGYDNTIKEFAKNLSILKQDSTVAVLKIRNFTQGNYNEAYHRIFDTLKQKKIESLIIDLRDNPGGKVADAVKLFSYLTDKEYTLLQPAIVTSKTSLWKLGLFSNIPVLAYPVAGVFYPFYMGFSYIRTTKNADGAYQYKLVGSKPRKNNPNFFDGKIYVMINGGTFSASCILSSSLKANPNVTFVGEETGGAFNGTVAGIMPLVKLPNSKIALRLGLMDIQTKNHTEIVGRGIFPDKEIIPTIEDKIEGKNPEMQWILTEISKNKKAQN